MNLPPFILSHIDRVWRRSVEAAATALFPPSDAFPDHQDADLGPRTQAYVDALPPTQRPLLILMFLAVEWLTPLLAFPGPRFSRRTPEQRLALVEHWRERGILPARLLGDALRATLVMVYYAHPTVLRAIGEPPEGEPLKATP